MSCFLIVKKTNKIYVWLAVDRQRLKVVDFEVKESRGLEAYKPLAQRLKTQYDIYISCSDYYSVYDQYPVAKQHVCSKAETCLVESFNSLIRHYLARFNRKTKRYSKAIDMMVNSILLLFNKHLLKTIFG